MKSGCLRHILGISQACFALGSFGTHHVTAVFEFVFLKVSIYAHSMQIVYYRHYNLLAALLKLAAVSRYLKLALWLNSDFKKLLHDLQVLPRAACRTENQRVLLWFWFCCYPVFHQGHTGCHSWWVTGYDVNYLPCTAPSWCLVTQPTSISKPAEQF